MSEEATITITSIDPPKKKLGRPKGSKTNTAAPAAKKTRKFVARSDSRASKADNVSIALSAQHYWLISAIAEARNVTRIEVLDGIISRFIASIALEDKQ